MTNTTKPKRPQVAKDWTKKVFKWLRQVKDDHELPPSGALFALQLTEHFNRHHGGAAWASCEHIAAGIGMSKGTVVNLLHLFERRGHLKVQWGKPGRGHSNQYWMIVKGQSADLSETVKGQIKGQSDAIKGQPTDLNLLKNHLSASKEAPKMVREASLRSPPLDVAGALEGAAPSKKKEERTDALKKEKKGSNKNVVATISRRPETGVDASNVVHLGADTFGELAEIWARPWADDEAVDRMAFAKALRDGADPAEIVEGAKCWVAAFAGDEARYLQPLAKWLNNCGWLKVPPTRRRRHRGQSIGDFMREQIKIERGPVLYYDSIEVAS